MRQPKPFFRQQTQTYYVQIKGRQINLGPDQAEAWKKYHGIMAMAANESTSLTVAVVLERFLDWCQRNQAPTTYKAHACYLKAFDRHVGRRLLLKDLKAFHVTQWAAVQFTKPNRHAIRSIQRAVNWAVEEGYLDASPVARVKKPPQGRRETFVTVEQWNRVVELIEEEEFRDVVRFMRLTGCRQMELRAIEATHYEDGPPPAIVLPKEIAKGKKNARILSLTEASEEIVKRLAAKWPEGRIFRTRGGKPWTRQGIQFRFQQLRKKTGIAGLCAYATRHTFATEAVTTAGLNEHEAAELMGHRNPKMIARHYGHLAEKRKHMAEAARKAAQAAE